MGIAIVKNLQNGENAECAGCAGSVCFFFRILGVFGTLQFNARTKREIKYEQI